MATRTTIWSIAVALMISGCALNLPRVLSIELEAYEKDVLVFNVEVSSPLSPVAYLEWTKAQIGKLGSPPHNPFYDETPVYELVYAFHSGGDRLAHVHYRADLSPASKGDLHYVRTYVYHDRAVGQAAP